jgi:hypothetical protein
MSTTLRLLLTSLALALIVHAARASYCESPLVLSNEIAHSLLGGGDGELIADYCCSFQSECDETEVLCSQNSTFDCMAGSAEGYRMYSVPNRNDCLTRQLGRECEQSPDKLVCAYRINCIYDEEVLKCIEDSGSDIVVPETCTDDCGPN